MCKLFKKKKKLKYVIVIIHEFSKLLFYKSWKNPVKCVYFYAYYYYVFCFFLQLYAFIPEQINQF